MSASPITSSSEFRSYRRFVSWVVLCLVSLGSFYLLLSVGVSIYQRRHVVPLGPAVGSPVSRAEVQSCWEELSSVTSALEKHLEQFHHLLGGYDPDEAQRWADEGAVWRNQLRALGARCRFSEVPKTRLKKEFEEMASAFEELRDTEDTYTKELLRFGKNQVPRLDRIRARVEMIGERISHAAPPSEGTDP